MRNLQAKGEMPMTQKILRLKNLRPLNVLKAVITIAVLFATVTPDIADAHSIYIQSGRHKVSEGKSTPLFFGFGHHIPVDDAIRRKKLKYVRVIAPDKSVTEIKLRDEKSLHSYPFPYDKKGTYTLIAETNPGYFALYTDKKGRRRHSLKPLSTFIDNAKEVESSMRSSQWAKTYVVASEQTNPFPAYVGLPLEIVPLKDVTNLKEGAEIEFQIYLDGKPYTGEGAWDATYNGFSTEAEDLYSPRQKLEGGKFTLKTVASGKWFVRFFTKTPTTGEKRKEYYTEKRTATLVFEIRNERRRPKDEHF